MRNHMGRLCVLLLGATGCTRGIKPEVAPPPQAATLTVHKSVDEIWPPVIGYLAVNNVLIQSLDRVQGRLTTVPFELSEQQRLGWIVCQAHGMAIAAADTAAFLASATVSVWARPTNDSTILRADMQVTAAHGRDPVICHSTGLFESHLFAAVEKAPRATASRPSDSHLGM
jgi:hypothetical protein